MRQTNLDKILPHNNYTWNKHIVSSKDKSKNIHCDLTPIQDDLEYHLMRSDLNYIVFQGHVNTLAIYVAEYLITRNIKIFRLITTFCRNNAIHHEEIIDIFREVVDENHTFIEPYHLHYDIGAHFVYLERLHDTAVILLRDVEIESSVALLSPEISHEEDIF